MQEGVLSLMQMAKISAALNRAGSSRPSVHIRPNQSHDRRRLGQFCFPGRLYLAEPGALIGFAGRRVIEQTIRQKLPDDFQTAEFLLKHGQLDQVVHRHELRDISGQFIRNSC